MTRPIPHSGEPLPIVGLGTAVSFPSANESQRARLKDVIDALVAGGGKLIDTASVYGNAESVIGDIVRTSNVRNKIFIATKIEVRSAKASADEFQRSLQRLRIEQVDLLQLHNVSLASQSLSQLREWKTAGRCRYVGITSTYSGDYNAMEAIIRLGAWSYALVGFVGWGIKEAGIIAIVMIDNLGAARGRLPDAQQRERMAALLTS